MPSHLLLMLWTAPTTGIAICPISTALEERRESAYGYKQTSSHLKLRSALHPASDILDRVGNDRCGSKAEVQRGPRNVRCWGKSGSRFRGTGRLLLAISRLSLLLKSSRTLAHWEAGGGSRPLHQMKTSAMGAPHSAVAIDIAVRIYRRDTAKMRVEYLRPRWEKPFAN